jgi:cation diffusion facilitator family transporter
MPVYNWLDDGYFNTEKRDLKQIRWVLVITMVLNFIAMGIKLIAGLLTGSLSMVADGLDSFFDGLSNVVGLGGLYAAGKPPDADHPYGHRKFETVAALSISFLLFLTCWQLLQTAWSRFNQDIAPEVNYWTVLAMLASILIQAGTSAYELRAGRRLKSEVLVADAMHTRASILVSLSVLVGLLFVRLGFPQADTLLAVFVALVIAKIGIDILRETLPVLVDQAAVDPQEIADVVSGVGGVESFHRVRSRGAEGSAAVDLHLRVSPDKTVQEADAIAHEVRRQLLNLENVNDVTVHLEANRQAKSDAADIFAIVKHAAEELGLTVHESWAHRIEGRLYIEIHVGVDPWMSLGEAHDQVDRLEHEVHLRIPEVCEVHTHIEMAAKGVQVGDRAPEELEKMVIDEIHRVVASMPSLDNPHNIIVRRDHGEKEAFSVSLECTIAPETPVSDAHQLSTALERELSDRLDGVVDVLVHLEPPTD